MVFDLKPYKIALVPYSRKPVIKNKKSGGYFKIRMLKLTSKALIPPCGVSG
jgi:hypothetical protein